MKRSWQNVQVLTLQIDPFDIFLYIYIERDVYRYVLYRTHIYIYIYVERERETDIFTKPYIHIIAYVSFVFPCMQRDIYIEREMARQREQLGLSEVRCATVMVALVLVC